MTSSSAMWGGRFQGHAEDVFRALNDSLPVDWRMVQEDIRGSVAWARALANVGVYSTSEFDRVRVALDEIASVAQAASEPPLESGAEDVHTWVEQQLTDRVGDLGRRLHTGRSRNDQVATDLRLWMRQATVGTCQSIRQVMGALVDQAETHAESPFPAYTHLQSAQPVTFGHWCLAYVEMLGRDHDRFVSAGERMNECPLGSAALAGTTYAIDRQAIAKELGFESPTRNSLDAIASRDHVIEWLSAAATMGVHLSRLAEDLSIYASVEFGLIELDDGVTSGSSLMPQKKNPDSLELIRGMSGQLSGAVVAMLTTVKALPMSYNKDLQFDKSILFDAVDLVSATLRLAARTVTGLCLDTDRAEQLAAMGHANATDLADLLVEAGIPFRTAHERVGHVVREAVDLGLTISELPAEVLGNLVPEVSREAIASLTTRQLLVKRDVFGGTAPVRVREQVDAAKRRLEA